MEKIKKWGKWGTVTVVLTVGFPLFFRIHNDMRFFWSSVSVFGICTQIYLLIKKREKKNFYLRNVAILLLSIIMANDLYRWQSIITVIPFLEDTPKSTLLLAAIVLILTVAIFAGLSNAYGLHKEKILPSNIRGLEKENGKDSHTMEVNQNYPKGTNENGKKGNSNNDKHIDGSKMEEMLEMRSSHIKNPLRARHVLGFLLATLAFAALALVVGYAFLVNQSKFEKFSMETLSLLIYATLWYFFVLISLAAICYLSIVFFTRVINLMKGAINKATPYHDSNILLGLSFLIAISICMIAPTRYSLDDVFLFLSGSEEVATLVLRVLQVTFTGFMTLVIYKFLCSMLQPEGKIRKSAEEIAQKFGDVFKKMIFSILDIADDIPDVFELMVKGIKNSVKYLYEMFVDEE